MYVCNYTITNNFIDFHSWECNFKNDTTFFFKELDTKVKDYTFIAFECKGHTLLVRKIHY